MSVTPEIFLSSCTPHSLSVCGCHCRSMPTLTMAATTEAGAGVNPHQAALKGDLVGIKQYIASGGALEVIDRNGR
jgi:hypothetical protein